MGNGDRKTPIKKPDENNNSNDDNHNSNNCPVCRRRRFTSKKTLETHFTKFHHHRLISSIKNDLGNKKFEFPSLPEPGDSMDTATYYLTPYEEIMRRYHRRSSAVNNHNSVKPKSDLTNEILVIDKDEVSSSVLDQVPITNSKFICIVCAKRFSTSQELRGHRDHYENTGNVLHKEEAAAPDDRDQVPIGVIIPCRKFVCIVCGRNFPTQEALRGHGEHRRIIGDFLHLSGYSNSELTNEVRKLVNNVYEAKPKVGMKVDDECLQEESCGSSQPDCEEEVEGGVGDKKDDSSVRKFSCRVCGKEFSTHQGLGGHMGCHREKSTTDHNHHLHNKEAAAAPGMKDDQEDNTSRVLANLPPENDSDEIVSNTKVIDFDLNEMPPNDED